MKCLIVEDDYITSQVLQEIVSAFGQTDLAENGIIAIEKFSEALTNTEPYDLILLDVMMPEMDGQEVLERIREIEQTNGIFGLDGVKVIMATALSDFENIKTSFKNQCEGYIVKPITKDKVINKIHEVGLI